MSKIGEARYLNVDFLVTAKFDLSPVVDALGENVFLLWNESSAKSSSFGIESNLVCTEGPEEDICEIMDIIHKLPNNIMNLLLRCHQKVFDIGYQCGTLNTPLDTCLSAETMKEISRLGCCNNIKLYPWWELPHEQ